MSWLKFFRKGDDPTSVGNKLSNTMIKVYAHLGPIHDKGQNLGDKFGFHIADFILGPDAYTKLGMHDVDKVDEETFTLVGSSIAAVVETPVKVLGAGVINPAVRKYGKSFQPIAVRGHLTKALLLRDTGKIVSVISDPGLLLSRIFPCTEVPPAQKKPLGFIVHKVDRPAFKEQYPQYIDCMIDNHLEPEDFIKRASQFERIASTALHGVIFSHSLGIPVAPFVLTDKLFGGEFKFIDYYSSLGIDISGRLSFSDEGEQGILEQVKQFPQPSADKIKALQKKQLELISSQLLGSQ